MLVFLFVMLAFVINVETLVWLFTESHYPRIPLRFLDLSVGRSGD